MKKGWEVKKLEEVADSDCSISYGIVQPGDEFADGLPVVRPTDLTTKVIELDHLKRIDPKLAVGYQRTTLHGGELLLCVRGSTGTVSIASEALSGANVTRGIVPIRFNKTLMSPAFGYYLMITDQVQSQIREKTYGAALMQINIRDLRNILLTYPPLPEQQHIVGILDKAFAGLAVAVANAEKNLQNARAFFESHLQSVFTQRGAGWEEKPLEDIADSDCSLSYGIVQPGEEFDEGMPVVRPTDLTQKVIRLSGLKRIDPKLAGGYKRTALQGGELLLCVRGSTGVVSIASPELVGANVTRGIVPIRFNRSLLLPEFGFYLIKSGSIQGQIREKTYGAALMQINIRDLRVISLSFPSLKEQATIAANLDALTTETERLAAIYERKLAALLELKKSLLHQAFGGEL